MWRYSFFFIFICFFALTPFKNFGLQFVYRDINAYNVGAGYSKLSLVSDPTAVILNPAGLVLEKRKLIVYYESYVSITVGNILELASRKVTFDPSIVGISFSVNSSFTYGLLYSTYIYDFEYPETSYKPILFSIASKPFEFLALGLSVGPMVAINEIETSYSFMSIIGTSIYLNDFYISGIFRTPFFVKWNRNPYYFNLKQTFPPSVGVGISYALSDFLLISFSVDHIFSGFASFEAENVNVSWTGDIFRDSKIGIGITFYSSQEGLKFSLGMVKDNIYILPSVLPQYGLTFGATGFIKLPFLKEEIEINASIRDGILLAISRIAPDNFQSIVGLVSLLVRFNL